MRSEPPTTLPLRTDCGAARSLVLAGAIAALLFASDASAVEEAALKAAIVYNILLFVEWPAAALPPPGGTLSLCVGPGSSVLASLKTLDRRELRGHRLELRELADRLDAMACHAVFVGAADRRRLEAALRRQRAAGALVISDDPDAPADSTAIVVSRVGQKIVIDVNLGPLRQAGLQLSSKLLRLARVVRQ